MANGTNNRKATYPQASCVIGVGDFGLSVLEELREEWQALRDSGVDNAVRNLSLLHLDGQERHQPSQWVTERESDASKLADFVGVKDEGRWALDFAILRSIGVVRRMNDVYQVAVPFDLGIKDLSLYRDRIQATKDDLLKNSKRTVNKETPNEPNGLDLDGITSEECDELLNTIERSPIQRLRTFRWVDLHQDPVLASQVLRHRIDEEPDFDLFISPLIRRIRKGHAPRAVTAVLHRVWAYLDGQDPSPWKHCQKIGEHLQTWSEGSTKGISPRSGSSDTWEDSSLPLGKLWRLREVHQLLHPLGGIPGGNQTYNECIGPKPDGPHKGYILKVPQQCRTDLRENEQRSALIEPRVFLEHDWMNEGWGSFGREYHPVDTFDLGWLGLGLVDAHLERRFLSAVDFRPEEPGTDEEDLIEHSKVEESPNPEIKGRTTGITREALDKKFEDRLKDLGSLGMQGLVGLLIDMEHMFVRDVTDNAPVGDGGPNDPENQRQSIEILNECFVGEGRFAQELSCDDDYIRRDPRKLFLSHFSPEKAKPSRALYEAQYPERPGQVTIRDLLDGRLRDLHLQDEVRKPSNLVIEPLYRKNRLLQQLTCSPSDLLLAKNPNGLSAFRRLVSRMVEELVSTRSVDELQVIEEKLEQDPPRLMVYVVCDLSEAFARAGLSLYVNALQAEVNRVYATLFKRFRSGRQRNFSVVPILWTPDELSGSIEQFELRGQETTNRISASMKAWDRYRYLRLASAVKAAHSFRKDIESLPLGTRSVAQVYVNSRVTDRSVLSNADAVLETADFITLMSRHHIAGDDLLTVVAEGPSGRDFLASFSCRRFSFPAERAREYLANRITRRVLQDFIATSSSPLSEDNDVKTQELTLLDQETKKGAKLYPLETSKVKQISKVDHVTDEARRRAISKEPNIDIATTVFDVLNYCGPEALGSLESDTIRLTHQLAQNREILEDFSIDRGQLNRKVSKYLFKLGNDQVKLKHSEQHRSSTYLQPILKRFRERVTNWRNNFEKGNREVTGRIDAVGREPKPNANERLKHPAEELRQAARDKPEHKTLRTIQVLLLLAGPALLAGFSQGLAVSWDLHLEGGLGELIIGKYGGIVMTLMASGLLWLAIRLLMIRHVNIIRHATQMFTESISALFIGKTKSVRAHFRAQAELIDQTIQLGAAARGRSVTSEEDRLVDRVLRSVNVQITNLRRHSESLSVSPDTGTEAVAKLPLEDHVDEIFGLGREVRQMIGPTDLLDFYRQRVLRLPKATDFVLEDVSEFHLSCLSGARLDDWRYNAPFSSKEAVLTGPRQTKSLTELVNQPDAALPHYVETVVPRLVNFQRTAFRSMGFPGNFRGYEGLDPDELAIVHQGQLIVHPEVLERLRRIWKTDNTCTAGDAEVLNALFKQSLIKGAGIRRTMLFMLSVAQGISPDVFMNLRRYESFLERTRTRKVSKQPPQGPWVGFAMHLAKAETRGLIEDRLGQLSVIEATDYAGAADYENYLEALDESAGPGSATASSSEDEVNSNSSEVTEVALGEDVFEGSEIDIVSNILDADPQTDSEGSDAMSGGTKTVTSKPTQDETSTESSSTTVVDNDLVQSQSPDEKTTPDDKDES
jgi:hypothetical protein